jgi:hypothetical protein
VNETNIPEPADTPDPYSASNGWVGNFPGDTLRGEIVERDTLETQKHGGGTAALLRITDADSDNGEVVDVACWRAHLKQLIEEHDPQPGDGIAITYHGQEPGGLRQLYSMRVAKGGE